MTKTAAPRVRTQNLYTIEQDGQPVAQAMAISQAEAVRLYVESVQQPTMSARLSSPIEARTLAHLPLLQREPVAKDTATEDLFASQEEIAGMRATALEMDLRGAREMLDEHGSAAAEPLAAGGFAPCGRALGDCGRATQTCGRDGCGVDVVEMPPQHAPIAAVLEGLSSGADVPQAGSCNLPAEFVDYLDGEDAAARPGEPAEPVALDASAPAGAEPGSSASAADDAPAADEAPTLAERMAGAYAAGMEFGRRGLKRFSAEMLDADVEMLRGIRSGADADVVHAELLRGFDDGKAQAEPVGTQERRRPPDEAPKGAGKVAAKYRNQATGESWSGRGLRPRWLVAAMDEGKALEDFLI